jgi:sugar phosphate isomerase/epimerase
MWKICLGVNGWASGRNDMGIHDFDIPIEAILDHAAELRYDGVEVISLSLDPYPEDLRDRQAADRYKAKYAERGLRIAGAQARAPRFGAHADEERRLECARAIVDNVVFAKALGADYLGVWPDERKPDVNDWVVAQRLVDTWRKVFDLLDREGIELGSLVICEEAEPPECFSDLSIAKAVIREVGHPGFKLLFDTAHANVMNQGRYLQAVKEFEGMIGHVHCADNDGGKWSSSRSGMSSKHLIIGEGNINMLSFFEALEHTGYNGWVQVDCWQNPDPFRCSRANKTVVDAIISDMKDGIRHL